MSRIIKLSIVLDIVLCILIGCGHTSNGTRAAKEVIQLIKENNMPKAKDAIEKYCETLSGQDLIDFGNVLEDAGVIY